MDGGNIEPSLVFAFYACGCVFLRKTFFEKRAEKKEAKKAATAKRDSSRARSVEKSTEARLKKQPCRISSIVV